MGFLSDLLATRQTNKKIDKYKAETKLNTRVAELMGRYNLTEEEAKAKAQHERRVDSVFNTIDDISKNVGGMASAPKNTEKKDKKDKDGYFDDILKF